MFAADESLHVGGAVKHGQETCEGHIGEEELVRVHGVHAEQALAHVHEALGNTDDEELVLGSLSRVITGQVTQVASKFGVVGSGSDQAKSENSAH